MREGLAVVTNKGVKLPSKEPVHFSSVYEGQWDLERFFPGDLSVILYVYVHSVMTSPLYVVKVLNGLSFHPST